MHGRPAPAQPCTALRTCPPMLGCLKMYMLCTGVGACRGASGAFIPSAGEQLQHSMRNSMPHIPAHQGCLCYVVAKHRMHTHKPSQAPSEAKPSRHRARASLLGMAVSMPPYFLRHTWYPRLRSTPATLSERENRRKTGSTSCIACPSLLIDSS